MEGQDGGTFFAAKNPQELRYIIPRRNKNGNGNMKQTTADDGYTARGIIGTARDDALSKDRNKNFNLVVHQIDSSTENQTRNKT